MVRAGKNSDFSLLENWFQQKQWTAFPFQQETWQAFTQKKSGLLNAATGSGKTYALWLPFLLWLKANPRKRGLKLIWITPLRALSADIQRAMQEAAHDLGIECTIAVRTGDTSTADRKKQKSSPPDCLITTPESMHLLMSQKKADRYFANLQCVVVDEWHELMGSKRGIQTQLAIAQVQQWTKLPLQIWGISATVGNLTEAMHALLGTRYKEGVLIRSSLSKHTEITSILPDEVEKFPWAGHLGIKLLPKLLPIIEQSRTTLLFTNTRSQTEIWYQKMLEYAPELAGSMAMHHGSIDTHIRKWVEEALHAGKLKLVICTSSLDLGVDFRPVETVIQVGGPKGVARFLQRAGRSGHQPGATSHIYFVPTHSLELIEAAALREAIKEDVIEAQPPIHKPLDVLVQFLITLAVGDGFYPDEVWETVKSTYAYRDITTEEWTWCLRFLQYGSQALQAYDEYAKVVVADGLWKISTRKMAMQHRLSIGTIVGDQVLKVRFVTGGYVGTIEESFLSKLNPGDGFWFGGRNLEFVRIKDLTVQVRKAKSKKGIVLRWMGGRMPLSSQLSQMIRQKLDKAAHHDVIQDIEMKTIIPILDLQQQWSIIPRQDQLLIEFTKTREGFHLFCFPFQGRAVHEVLASLVAYRISVSQPVTFSIAMNDYGFELLTDLELDPEEALSLDLFSMENLEQDIHHSLNSTEMARRKFRDIATISGLIFQGYPGRPMTGKHLQSSSGILYDVFAEYEPNNLLYQQAMREVFHQQLELDRLQQTLESIKRQEIALKKTPRPTPFAFPVMVDRLREKLSSESLEDRVARMQLQLEKVASK